MRRRRGAFLIPTVLSGGFSLPYTLDPSTLADGALPAPWVGGTFAVSSGVIVNAPGVGSNLLTDPGLEATYTAGLCDTLTKGGSPTVAEETTDVHGGSKAQEFTGAASTNALYWLAAQGEVNAWYRFKCWVKRTAGANTETFIRTYQADSFPGAGDSAYHAISVDDWNENEVSFISTTTNWILAYPAYTLGSADYITALCDDGTLQKLTYSTLFAMLSQSVGRLTTVKAKPVITGTNHAADGTLSYLIHWADSSASPTTLLMAYYSTNSVDTQLAIGLIKIVDGTPTELIAPTGVTGVDGAWLEIRPTDNDTVGLYYNNTQVGSDADVADVPGSYCGFGITGGNNLEGFFVG